MSDYNRNRWKEIQAMGPRARWAPGYDRKPIERRPRRGGSAAHRRAHGVTLHPKHIDHAAKAYSGAFHDNRSSIYREAVRFPGSRKPEYIKAVGHRAAPAGCRWSHGKLVAR